MISIGEISFIIIIQLIILLVMLAVFLLFLLRSKNKKIRALMLASNSHNEVSPSASLEHYMTTEIKLTTARFDLFYKDDDLQSEVFAEPDWLILRKNFLEIEKELLVSDEREDAFWLEIGKKLKKLLSNTNLVKRIKTKEVQDDDEDELKEMKLLLKSQYDEFDNLYLELEGDKSEAEVKELKEKLTSIIRSHTELSHCIYILEDENLFLRDQIKEIL